jgi:hypothetical protein
VLFNVSKQQEWIAVRKRKAESRENKPLSALNIQQIIHFGKLTSRAPSYPFLEFSMFHALTISLALSTTAVAPGEAVENHGGWWQNTQPTIRRFERKPQDMARKLSWEAYCHELDRLWTNYRLAGSTREAFEQYKAAAMDLKSRYVYGDAYLAPILP